eukprot:3869799-Pleurochrysis_carterae.AAC.3
MRETTASASAHERKSTSRHESKTRGRLRGCRACVCSVRCAANASGAPLYGGSEGVTSGPGGRATACAESKRDGKKGLRCCWCAKVGPPPTVRISTANRLRYDLGGDSLGARGGEGEHESQA